MPSKSDSLEQPVFSQNNFLNKLRYALWPIKGSELKKFLPLSVMMALVIAIYYAARCIKDSGVVSNAGAEAIPYLKTFGVVPFSIIFFIIFAKMSNKLTRERVFYVTTAAFLVFFAAYALVIYPNHEAIEPSAASVASAKAAVPQIKFLFGLWGTWTSATFYIMAELWGSVALSLLFWQFANQITRTREAIRFYSMMALLANAFLIPTGFLIDYLSKAGKSPGRSDTAAWGISLYYLMGVIVIAGVLLMLTYRWMNRKVLTDPKQYDEADSTKAKKKPKVKLSLMDSARFILSSKYLMAIAVLVICYGVTINLVEITWKSQLAEYFPNKNDYNSFMGQFTALTGASTVVSILFMKGIIRRFGWFAGAVITPIVILVTGVLFYALVIFRGELGWLSAAMGATPVLLAVIVGTAQNVFSKGSKYSLFDPTKEMAYIPLDDESKGKGKAAVDVIGGRFGKSGGSILEIILFAIAGSAASAVSLAPAFAGIMIVMLIVWIFSSRRLSNMYALALKKREDEDKIVELEKAYASDSKEDPKEVTTAA